MRSMKSFAQTQTGAVLVVGLVLLIVLTLMGISAINVSTLNLRNVRNMQYRQVVLDVAQQAIEEVMSSPTNFTTPETVFTETNNTKTLQISAPVGGSGGTQSYSVKVRIPICTNSGVRVGGQLASSLGSTFTFYDTYWDIGANVNDAVTGARAEVHQGVMVPMVTQCN